MRILLVEDEIGQYETFIDILEDVSLNEDISLSWAESSQKAILKLETESFDLAFIDINLRGSLNNGIELCEILRNKLKLSFPIVIYSISRNPEDKTASLEAGANFYLIKPFRYNQFVEEIKSLLTRIREKDKV